MSQYIDLKGDFSIMAQFIPKVDDLNDNHLEGPFKVLGKKYIQLELENNIVEDLLRIQITKNSFIKKLTTSIKYMNYFVKYYDTDGELESAYLMLLFSIQNMDIEFDREQFYYTLVNLFSTDTMVDKIYRLVEHNIEEADMKKSAGRKSSNEAIQITHDHLKAIMALAVIHKCIIPIVSCYYNIRKDELKDDAGKTIHEKDFYFICFTMFIPVFDRVYDVDLYSKLYHTASTRIAKTRKHDEAMWDRRRAFASTKITQQSKLMKDLFVDISQKAIFTRNAIALIHVSFDKTIKNHLIQKDKYDVTEMSMNEDDNDDNATQFDLLQMNNAKYSIEDKNRANLLINSTIKKLEREYDIEITEKDIKFYQKYYKINDTDDIYTPAGEIQINILYLFFSKYVNSYYIMNYIKPKQFIKIMIIFKEIMTQCGYRYLPHLISGNIDKVSSKRFNKMKLQKLIMNHPLYEDLSDSYSVLRGQISKEKFIESLRDIVTTKVYVVDHRFPDESKDGDFLDITDSYEAISDEIVRFLLSI